jgi:hypothetical protein
VVLVPPLKLNDTRAVNQYEIESLWIKSGLDVAFQYGDVARIKSGEDVGKEGQIIALISLEPSPTYVMELPDGSSVVAIEPDLEFIQGNTGRTLILVPRS